MDIGEGLCFGECCERCKPDDLQTCTPWANNKNKIKKKRNEILPFATTWMELEGIMLSEISQSEKDNYHMISLI